MNGVGDSPLIHIVDSPNDTFGTDAAVFERTMDAFTAHPELNAFFLDNGGGTGAVEALDAMGLLKPVNDPDHIVLGFNDIDTRVVQAMDDGHLDVILSHIFHDLVDLAVKAMFTNLVLGESVPQDMVTPEVLITPDNIDSAKIGGVIVAYPRLPASNWDLWPALNFSEPGSVLSYPDLEPLSIETPTAAMRQDLLGY